jgi:hypothetical protein
MVTSISEVDKKLIVLARVTDTDFPLNDLPEWEDHGEYRTLKMTLQTLQATIGGQ